MTTAGITRRELVQWLGAVTAAAAIGCKNKRPAASEGTLDRWAVLAELLAAVRSSPDHLVARAQRLVAAKDADAIFAFVRDAILTAPVYGDLDAGTREVRWGVRGTLRGGVGTPRDKAELLRSLLAEAGFGAVMVQGKMAPAAVAADYARQRTLEFAPAIDDDTLARWRSVLGATAPAAPATAIDPDGTEAAALAAQLAPLVPAAVASREPGAAPEWMPLVQLTRNGATVVANPFVAAAALGAANASGVTALGDHGPFPRATVKLQYATTDNPYGLRDAVSGDWSLEDLVGRRIHAHFHPLLPAGGWLVAAPATVPAFAPMLTLHGPDVTRDLASKLSVTGDVIQADGTPIQVVDNEVIVGGRKVPRGKADPALVARVKRAALTIDPSTFPQVSARVLMLDAAGHAVAGLSAGAFSLVEAGADRAAVIAGPLDVTPRIAVLFDGSTSVPDEFRLPAKRAALAKAIADGVHVAIPGAQLRVGGIDGGPVWAGDWTTDAAAVDANARAITTAGDQLWGAYAGAVKAGATLVVLVSDGLSTDELLAVAEPVVRTGPPCIALAVADAAAGMFPALTTRTGGKSIAVANQADAVAAVTAFAGAAGAFPYSITWPALAEGPASREVVLQLRGSAVKVTASYTVPDAARRVAPQRIAGLFLAVGFGSEPVVRRIAGKAAGIGGRDATAAEAAEAFAAISGLQQLSFEGGAPPFALWADEWISNVIASRPLREAADREDARAVRRLIEGGELRTTPRELATLHAELGPVVPAKARVVRLAMRVRPASGHAQGIVRGADLLPAGRMMAHGIDRASRLNTVLRATARQARIEGALAKTSTYARLAGAKLRVGTIADLATLFPALSAPQRDAWLRLLQGWDGQTLLFPEAPATLACWALDPITGSLLGVIDDGSGGAREDICATLHQAQSMLAIIAMMGTAAGASLGFGVWLSLSKTYMTLVLESAIAIARLEDGAGDAVTDLDRAMLDLACDLGFGWGFDHLAGSSTLWAAGLGTGLAYATSVNDLLAANNRSNLSCSNNLLGQQPGVCP